MGVIDRLKSVSGKSKEDFEAIEVDEELWSAYEARLPDRGILKLIPYQDNDGVGAMKDFLSSIHKVKKESSRFGSSEKNVSAANSCEIRFGPSEKYEQPMVHFQYLPGSAENARTFKRQLKQHYPNSDVESRRPTFLDIETGDYLAGCVLHLNRYTFYPINNDTLEGFRTDPTGSVIKEMAVESGEGVDSHVVAQVMFKPATKDWYEHGEKKHFGLSGVDKEKKSILNSCPGPRELAEHLRSPRMEVDERPLWNKKVEVEPSSTDKEIASELEDLTEHKGWNFTIRIFAKADDPKLACRRVQNVAAQFDKYTYEKADQGFVPEPLSGKHLKREFTAATAREFRDIGCLKSQPELANIINVPPADDVHTPRMKWKRGQKTEGIPPGTPRYEFGPELEQRKQRVKQVRMLEDSGKRDPWWYGWGKTNGTEAGVSHDVLRTHQAVGGETGSGKTTFLKHFWRQVGTKGFGGLFVDPKGKDTDEILAMIPPERRNDVIYIELGSDRDREIGFNFLEPPTDAEPGTAQFENAVQSMAGDVEALLSEAGSDSSKWGTRMKQITRNMALGLGKAGYSYTLLDMYLALLEDERRQEYAEMVAAERLDWISNYAQSELADMDQSDVRPVIGRLKELVENDITRRIISHPQSTFSVREAVKDGKLIVVSDKTTDDGQPISQWVTTALVRRLWIAIREQTHNPNVPNPEEFYIAIDELRKVVTDTANIEQILAEARGFGLSMTLATQDFSNQLPDSMVKAIEGQCKTFISYNASRKEEARKIAAQHSEKVDWNAITELDRYTFYMRTHDEDDSLTHSYKVEAFYPLEELADVSLNDKQVEALKQLSLKNYGVEKRSDQDLREQSGFHPARASSSGGASRSQPQQAGGPAGRPQQSQDGVTKDDVIKLLRAVNYVEIKQEKISEFVSHEPVVARAREKLDKSESGVADTIEQVVAEGYLEQRKGRSDQDANKKEIQLKLTVDGRKKCGLIQTSGEGASAGFIEHRRLLRQVRHLFIKLDCECRIPTQGGEELPDALVEMPIDLSEYTANPVEYERKLDEFKREYSTLYDLCRAREIAVEAEKATLGTPAQTLTNLRKAMEQGRYCLFIVDDGTIEHDSFTYWADRAEGILYNRPNKNTIDYSTLSPRKAETQPATYYTSQSKHFEIDGKVVVRPADKGSRTYWIRRDNGNIAIETNEEHTCATFDSPEAARNASVADIPGVYEYDEQEGEHVVRTQEGDEKRYESNDHFNKNWTKVSDPFFPETDLPRELEESDFGIAIIPSSESEYDTPQLYKHGELEPLVDDIEINSPEIDSEEGHSSSESGHSDGENGSEGSPEADVGEQPAGEARPAQPDDDEHTSNEDTKSENKDEGGPTESVSTGRAAYLYWLESATNG